MMDVSRTVPGRCSGCGAGTTAPGLCERCIWRVTMAKRSVTVAGSAAFAAMEAIESGEWDRYLLRLRVAIEQRRGTQEYRDHIIAGEDKP